MTEIGEINRVEDSDNEKMFYKFQDVYASNFRISLAPRVGFPKSDFEEKPEKQIDLEIFIFDGGDNNFIGKAFVEIAIKDVDNLRDKIQKYLRQEDTQPVTLLKILRKDDGYKSI
jgi:hypothetical protein